MENEQSKSRWKEFFQLGEVGGYFFRKKDPSRPKNIKYQGHAHYQQNSHSDVPDMPVDHPEALYLRILSDCAQFARSST
jgi:hypothetical protein